MIKIGNVKLENNLILAPMVGINDTAFRLLCKKYGAGLICTEMINANAIFKNNKATINKLDIVKEERPISVQLFGANTEMLEYAAKVVEKDADIIDLNFGCPDTKVLKQGAGAALLKRPKKIEEIVKAVVKKVNIPVTAKIRIGINKPDLGLKLAKLIENAGASAIAVHGRTSAQGYSGKANWNAIKEIKENVNIPVIGNGDIFSGEDAERMLELTKCDFLMIGRQAMINPYIFTEVNNYLKNKKVIKITNKDKIKLFSEYIKLADKYGYPKFEFVKRHALNFSKGIRNSVKLRTNI
ncbi:MAG: tRNA dihydrouridine synthase DusB, partial [Candidatus Nanoarchaeia archaeon]|nr:tRNA dihydrouridine synthase DusB [Candidatus Nanoarchaeia archaeon]